MKLFLTGGKCRTLPNIGGGGNVGGGGANVGGVANVRGGGQMSLTGMDRCARIYVCVYLELGLEFEKK